MSLYNVRKTNSGFTLIEMIVVVIIVGVIAAIAVPNFLGLLNQNRVKEGLADIESAIKEAQKIATRRGKTCKIVLTTAVVDSQTKSTVQVAPNAAPEDYTGCLLTTRTLSNDISFSNASGATIDSANTKTITFSGKGNTDAASGGTIVVRHTGTTTQKCLVIEGFLGNMYTGNFDDPEGDGTGTCRAS